MMPSTNLPFLVASCGNALAADDAFGPLVAEQVRELNLPGVEVVELGMQPYGLLFRLENRNEVIIVDAAQATADFPAGMLLEVDFFGSRQLQLLHDVALSTHGLSIADELELARKLDMLPRRVKLVAATVEEVTLGRSLTPATRRLIRPAVRRVARIARQSRTTFGIRCHA